jgi:sugar phosphate permease
MNETAPAKLSLFNDPLKYRWLMFVIGGIIYFFACLHRVSPTVIAQDLTLEFTLNATMLGLIASAYFYLYAFIQPPVGVLSDTIGPRRVVTFFTLIACIGSIVFGMATNPVMAIFGRCLIGIGVGGIFVPALKIFSQWFRPDEFASLAGIMLAIGYLGGIFASAPLTLLVLNVGWRISFIIIGVLTVLMGGLFWIIARDKPEDKGWPSIAAGPQTSKIDQDAPAGITTKQRLKRVVIHPGFWMITLSIFFVGGAGITFTGLWAVPFLIDIHHYSRMESGTMLMLSMIGFACGAAMSGFLVDKLGLNKKTIVIVTLSLGIIYYTLFCTIGDKLPNTVLIIIFLVMGICGGSTVPIFMAMTKELFPNWLTGTAIGLMNPAAFLATAIYQPITGLLMDRVGKTSSGGFPYEAYQQVFIMFLGAFIISLVFICLFKAPKQ